MDTNAFLDAVKARHRLSSDYQLAKFLGWRQQRTTDYRNTGRQLDDVACIQVAEALELPPAYVMAEIAAERAKSAEARRYWRQAAALLKQGKVAVLATAFLGGAFCTAPRIGPQPVEVTTNIHYAHKRRGAARA